MILARSKEKNKAIKGKKGRKGMGFEDVEEAILNGNILAITRNKNQEKYP